MKNIVNEWDLSELYDNKEEAVVKLEQIDFRYKNYINKLMYDKIEDSVVEELEKIIFYFNLKLVLECNNYYYRQIITKAENLYYEISELPNIIKDELEISKPYQIMDRIECLQNDVIKQYNELLYKSITNVEKHNSIMLTGEREDRKNEYENLFFSLHNNREKFFELMKIYLLNKKLVNDNRNNNLWC